MSKIDGTFRYMTYDDLKAFAPDASGQKDGQRFSRIADRVVQAALLSQKKEDPVEMYDKRLKEVEKLLKDVKGKIDRDAFEAKKRGVNWADSGTLGKVIAELKDIETFLN